MARPILLTGASGFLGHYLVAESERRGVSILRAGRRGADLPLDLEDEGSLRGALRAARPRVVLHAAALSSLSACEADPTRADVVNRRAARILADESRGRVVLVSTDLVFDGAAAPYRARDSARPRSVYGRSKLRAEGAVTAAGGLAVRIPLLFGRSFDGRRGATDMLRSASGVVRLYSNEYRTPLHAADAAGALVDLALAPPGSGVIQLAGPERVSRLELAERFRACTGCGPRVEPALCVDPLRPRDVSLVADRPCARGLDEALAAS